MQQTQNNQQLNPSLLSEERKCDLCAKPHDIIDMVPCPTGNGYYCQDCVKEGDVSSYLKRIFKYNKGTITKFINSIAL